MDLLIDFLGELLIDLDVSFFVKDQYNFHLLFSPLFYFSLYR